MGSRPRPRRLLVLLVFLVMASGCGYAIGLVRADPAPVLPIVAVRFSANAAAHSPAPPATPALTPWEEWAGSRRLPVTAPDTAPDGACFAVGWLDRSHHAAQEGVEFVNSGASSVKLRLSVPLPGGLWRVDAALVPGVTDAAGTDKTNEAATKDIPTATVPPHLWRMESLLLTDDGETVKTLGVPPHTALFLRWTETGEAALDARKSVRLALLSTADTTLQERVSGALMPVDDALDALPLLVAQGDRAKITRRIHTALLATAKAQALWENGRGNSLDERDAPFARLVTALSEIACAGFDLVPGQTFLPAQGTTPARMRVTLTNAGPRMVPLVALGVEHARRGAGEAVGMGSDLRVFHALAPGASISETFPLHGDGSGAGETELPEVADVRGIVQFISDYGAATVEAAPEGLEPLTPRPLPYQSFLLPGQGVPVVPVCFLWRKMP